MVKRAPSGCGVAPAPAPVRLKPEPLINISVFAAETAKSATVLLPGAEKVNWLAPALPVIVVLPPAKNTSPPAPPVSLSTPVPA